MGIKRPVVLSPEQVTLGQAIPGQTPISICRRRETTAVPVWHKGLPRRRRQPLSLGTAYLGSRHLVPGGTRSHRRDGGRTTNPLKQGTNARMEPGELKPPLLGTSGHF